MMGIPPKNIVMMENGRVVELDENEIKFNGMVPNGRVLVDGLGVGDVGNIVLRDRQHLSQDGLIVIVLTMDSSTGEVVAGPDVISRGFVYVRESENLMDDVKNVVRHEIRKCEEKGIRDWSTIKSTVRENLRDYLKQKGIETRPTFYPVHTMPMYDNKYQSLPVAEKLGWSGVNLPSYPGLKDEEVKYVCDSIKEYFNIG